MQLCGALRIGILLHTFATIITACARFCNGIFERAGERAGSGDKGKAVRTEKEAFRRFSENLVISSPQYGSREEYKKYLEKVRRGERPLKESDAALLAQIPNAGDWKKIKPEEANIETLALLTAQTGDEFALFAKGDKKIIVHGKSSNWRIPEAAQKEIFYHQLNWTGYSHPTTTAISSSPEDQDTLKQFTWQKKSSIIDLTGEVIKFTPKESDKINRLLGVKK